MPTSHSWIEMLNLEWCEFQKEQQRAARTWGVEEDEASSPTLDQAATAARKLAASSITFSKDSLVLG